MSGPAAPNRRARAPLIEIFHSIQGEGRHVGVPMAFVRVATCPIRCGYCDTPHSYAAPPAFPVAGVGDEPNPVDAARAAELVLAAAERSPFAAATGPLSVSVTGGEPLVVPGFVRALGETLGSRARLHLETAALDATALREVLPVLAHISADYKLPGTLLGSDDPRDAHVACLERAVLGSAATIDVKLVITPTVRAADLDDALLRLSPFRDRVLLVIQPVTPHGTVTAPPPTELLADAASRARRAGFRFLVLPQVHKQLRLA